jgi:hypothetical protein
MDVVEWGEWLGKMFRRGRRRDADFWEDLDGHWEKGIGVGIDRFDVEKLESVEKKKNEG